MKKTLIIIATALIASLAYISVSNAYIFNPGSGSGGNSGGGSVSTSSAVTAFNVPYWTNTTGGLAGSSTIFYSSSTGNIGIGTTTSTANLSVAGTLNPFSVTDNTAGGLSMLVGSLGCGVGYIGISFAGTGCSNYAFLAGTGQTFINAPTLDVELRENNNTHMAVGNLGASVNGGSGNAPLYPFSVAAVSPSPFFVVTGSSSVGIGTVLPLQTFDVRGTADITGGMVVGSTTAGAWGEGAEMNILADNSNAQQVVIQGLTDGRKQMLFGYNTTGNYAAISSLWQQNAFTPLALQPTGGVVTIATTTGDSYLTVNGNVRLEGLSSIVTPAIGGSLLGSVGSCSTATSSIDTTANATSIFLTSPNTLMNPGSFSWNTQYLSSGVAITYVCAEVIGTPTSTTYTVKMIK